MAMLKQICTLFFLFLTFTHASESSKSENQTTAHTHTTFPYGKTKIRGVSLGGWLVLEPWITPSLFDNTGDNRIVDEWTFVQYQDHGRALTALTRHWETFIREDDFAYIAASGLNHVRIPIGYWAFDVSKGEPYIQGQLPYLRKAVKWAESHGLNAIIDLHGAPGSQNGFDNSGQKKTAPEWHKNPENIQRTHNVVKQIVAEFKDSPATTVIAPLNEPAGFIGDDILQAAKQFWLDSYETIRYPNGHTNPTNTIDMISDAFKYDYWKGFMNHDHGYDGVILDTHIYQVFTVAEVALSNEQHIQTACSIGPTLTGPGILWVVIGEWSPASTDCAKYLNGRWMGARYDGTYPDSTRVGSCVGKTGKAEGFSKEYKDFLRKFWETQVMSYEMAQGWIQWTWKTESADEWSYKAGLENGWIPKDRGDLIYRGICRR